MAFYLPRLLPNAKSKQHVNKECQYIEPDFQSKVLALENSYTLELSITLKNANVWS